MEKIIEFLKETPVQIIGSIQGDHPQARPFQYMCKDDSKLWWCTNMKKDVYKELQANPHIDVCVCSPHSKWLRLDGKAIFEDNMDVKEICMQNPLVKKLYQTADNPIFTVFYIADAHAAIHDLTGNPPYETTF